MSPAKDMILFDITNEYEKVICLCSKIQTEQSSYSAMFNIAE
jgi:hypothetical protein